MIFFCQWILVRCRSIYNNLAEGNNCLKCNWKLLLFRHNVRICGQFTSFTFSINFPRLRLFWIPIACNRFVGNVQSSVSVALKSHCFITILLLTFKCFSYFLFCTTKTSCLYGVCLTFCHSLAVWVSSLSVCPPLCIICGFKSYFFLQKK